MSTGSLATDAGSLATDAGSLATDAGSLATDAGSLATDAGSLATDAGSLATDAGSLATDAGDENYDTHILSSVDGIPTPQQCTGCGLTAANGLSAINLAWTPPGTGGSLTYNIYRCAGAGCTPTVPAFKTGWLPPSASAPTFADSVNDSVDAGGTCPGTSTCYNTVYTYSVTALTSLGSESGYSNTASSEVTHLFVIADNQAVVYGSANPTPAFHVYGDFGGSLNGSLVSCAYTPTVPRNAGNYPIACTGPATASTTDGVTYNAAYLTFTPGSLTISQRPITVMAAASSKTYDGSRSSLATPTIVLGSLAYQSAVPPDSVTWTESYDNQNVGTSHIMTPSGVVSDLNGGKNYAVTFVTINTGVINKAPLRITAAANTKTYDANTSAAAVPTVSGLQSNDSVTGRAETYDTANAGTGKTLSVSAYTVNDGNSGGNYAVTLVTNTTGVINRANAIITVTPYSVTYDTHPHTATGTAKGVLGEVLTGLDLSGTTHTSPADYTSDPWTFTDSTGNYNNAGGTVHDSIANTQSQLVIGFHSGSAPTGGTISYDGAGGPLVGFISLELLTSRSTPLNSGGSYHVSNGSLSFTTGNFTSFDPVLGQYNFSAGGNLTIAGGVPDISLPDGTVLANGATVSAQYHANGEVTVVIGTDTKSPALLTFFGLPAATPFRFSLSALASLSSGSYTGGAFTAQAAEVDIDNRLVP